MPQQVNSIATSLCQDSELQTLVTRLSKTITESALVNPILRSLCDDSLQNLKNLRRALDRVRKSELTTEIRLADELRDQHFVSFKKGVAFHLSLKGEAEEESALYLNKIIKKRGDQLHNESDAVETVKLNALFGDLADSKAQRALEAGGFVGIIEQLQEQNQKYERLVAERAANDAEDTTPTLKPTRQILGQNLNLMVDLLGFHLRRDEPTYKPVVAEVNEIITEVMTIVKARKSRKMGEATAE